LAGNNSGDGRRRGGRRSDAAAAMSVSRRVGRTMHVHGRVQGVWVEATAVLGLEEGRRTVGRTSDLRPAATAGAARRLGTAPGRMRGRRRAWGVGRAYWRACTPAGSASGSVRAWRVCAWPWARPQWPACGPRHDGVRTAGGVGPAWAPAWRRRHDVARRAHSGVPACFRFAEAPFDRFKLKNFEPKFKFAKYESCRLDNPLQLS
jgi:hypothetical protein